MKTALITTTIRVPHVLALYREYAGPGVRFFVAGDMKAPHQGIIELLREIGNAEYTTDITTHPYAPLNSTCRRNIALLAALRWGADVIISIDDDNFGIDSDYFINFGTLFQRWDRPDTHRPWHGLQVTTKNGWVDPGFFLLPQYSHRG
ncbi:MAG: hypothetical protein ABSH36_15370, partial [Solirubrobacteraceae bacterium]